MLCFCAAQLAFSGQVLSTMLVRASRTFGPFERTFSSGTVLVAGTCAAGITRYQMSDAIEQTASSARSAIGGIALLKGVLRKAVWNCCSRLQFPLMRQLRIESEVAALFRWAEKDLVEEEVRADARDDDELEGIRGYRRGGWIGEAGEPVSFHFGVD